ncbi:unnamed protein product, partial [Leishmania donovani]
HRLAPLSPPRPHRTRRRRGPGLHSKSPRRSKSTEHKRGRRVRFESLTRLVVSRCKPDHHDREPLRHSASPALSVGTHSPQPYTRARSGLSPHRVGAAS